MRSPSILLASLLCLGAVPALAQATGPMVVTGTVAGVDATSISVRDDKGGTSERLTLAPNVMVIEAKPATLADIKADDFIASAAVRGMDGKLHSTELRIFPAAMRGLGEGQRSMNDPRGQTMTNATVTGAAVVNGSNNLKVKFAGGESELVVDPDVPVTRMDIGQRSALVPGAHVRAQGVRTAEGASVSRITVQ
jgi:hypothetical protein